MTTNVIKKIGATNSPVTMDYSTLAAWAAAVPDVVAVDQRWIGEVYNQGTLVLSGNVLIDAASGDATHWVILRAASGAGFKTTPGNPLRYDESKGASITGNFNYAPLITCGQSTWLEISGLQFNKQGSGGGISYNGTSGGAYYHENIVDIQSGPGIGTYVMGPDSAHSNCLIENNLIVTSNANNVGIYQGNASNIRNNTIITIGGGGKTGAVCGYGVIWAYNNAIFGFNSPLEGGSGGLGGNNITGAANYSNSNIAAPGTTGAAFTTANFTNLTSGSYDFKIPSGSALKDAGDNAHAPTVDIFGGSRPQGTTSDIGAYELVSAAPAPTADEMPFHPVF